MSSTGYTNGERVGKGSHCKVCGVSSYEQTLIGLKNDRKAKPGVRFCLPHHPDSFVGAGAYVLEMSAS